MSNKIKIDYHFHPNIAYRTDWSQKKRLKKIWKQINKFGLDGVLVCEHVSKKPEYTFNKLLEFRPSDSKTYLIPGIEAYSKEGLHIIIYSKSREYIYNQDKLLVPGMLNFDEIVQKVVDDNRLFGIIVHPYCLSNTGVVKAKGEEYAKKVIKKIGVVEGYNHGYIQSEKLLKYKMIRKILGERKSAWIKWTRELPKTLYKKEDDLLITGGSDAHHPWEIGSHMSISVNKKINNYKNLFEVISSSNNGEFVPKKPGLNLLHFVRSGLTILREWGIRTWKK